jgi:hypothetical protein
MGDIADMMIDGTLDSVTGEYLGEGPGFPRTMYSRRESRGLNARAGRALGYTGRDKHTYGVLHYLHYKQKSLLLNCSNPLEGAVEHIKRYCAKELNKPVPKLKTCCNLIQQDFQAFKAYIEATEERYALNKQRNNGHTD